MGIRIKTAFLVLWLSAVPAPVLAGTAEEDVLATVARFFEGLHTSNPDIWREVVHENAWFYALRKQDDGTWTMDQYPAPERIEDLAGNTAVLDERIYEPVVEVRGPIASVWAPYAIYIDNEFSHCGIDAFALVQMEAGWKIVNLSYTTEPDACEELGVPLIRTDPVAQ